MKRGNAVDNGLGLYKPYTSIPDVKTPFSAWERIEANEEDTLIKEGKYGMMNKIRKIAEKMVAELFAPAWKEVGVYDEPEKLAGILTAVGHRVKVTRNVLLADSRDEGKVKEYIQSNGINEKYPLTKVWSVNQ